MSFWQFSQNFTELMDRTPESAVANLVQVSECKSWLHNVCECAFQFAHDVLTSIVCFTMTSGCWLQLEEGPRTRHLVQLKRASRLIYSIRRLRWTDARVAC